MRYDSAYLKNNWYWIVAAVVLVSLLAAGNYLGSEEKYANLTVSTDRSTYTQGEKVQLRIQWKGFPPGDLPEWAGGVFPSVCSSLVVSNEAGESVKEYQSTDFSEGVNPEALLLFDTTTVPPGTYTFTAECTTATENTPPCPEDRQEDEFTPCPDTNLYNRDKGSATFHIES